MDGSISLDTSTTVLLDFFNSWNTWPILPSKWIPFKKIISPFCKVDTSPALAWYKCGSTPAPINPCTVTWSPPIFCTKSVIIVVVVTTCNGLLSCTVSACFPQPAIAIIQTANTMNNRHNLNSFMVFPPLLNMWDVPYYP